MPWLAALLALGCAAGCPPSAANRSFGGGGGANRNSASQPPDSSVAREIEEADIVKYVDGYFYLANRYRGLRIIDARIIERPRLVGGLPLQGRGVELFVDRDRVFIVTSADFFECAGQPVSFEDAGLGATLLRPDYTGSRITVVDVSDPSAPAEISHFDMDGFITATRRVGEVIYAAGNFEGAPLQNSNTNANTNANRNDNGSTAPPPPSATGEAVTIDSTGSVTTSVTSPAGFIGAVQLSGGQPGAFVQVRVTEGNTRADYRGIPDGAAVPATLSVNSNSDTAGLRAVVSLLVGPEDLMLAGATPENFAFYRYDEVLSAWVAAARNSVGLADPTDTLNDYGYVVADEAGNLTLWAVVDQLGDFAIGRRFPDSVTLTISEVPGGSVSATPALNLYPYGTIVTLQAMPNSGFRLDGWTGDFVQVGAPIGDSIQIELLTDVQVTAQFAPTASGDSTPRVFVVSLNIADSDNIRMVDREDVLGESLDIEVTQNAIYVLGDDPTLADTTRVNYIDISDPAGDIAARDVFRVPGRISNRFFAGEYQGIFRIVTQDIVATGLSRVIALYLYDATNPDDVQRLGQLTIETGSRLRSVRFDRERAYVVMEGRLDPLRVLDLSDPNDPVLAGEVQAPGSATHMVPLGDRLVAIGFDDLANLRTAVILYDVANAYNPRLLARINLGENGIRFSTSEATVDHQALKVLPEEDLILVPISTFDTERRRFVDLLQLVDLLPTRLVERGLVEHRGLVRRAGVTDDRLWVLSDEAFQVADINDRDQILALANLDVISEQELLDAGLLDCVDSARTRGFPFGVFLGNDVVFFRGGPCGVIGLVPMGLILAGLCALGLVRQRCR